MFKQKVSHSQWCHLDFTFTHKIQWKKMSKLCPSMENCALSFYGCGCACMHRYLCIKLKTFIYFPCYIYSILQVVCYSEEWLKIKSPFLSYRSRIAKFTEGKSHIQSTSNVGEPPGRCLTAMIFKKHLMCILKYIYPPWASLKLLF